jgi:T5orf172 domain
MVVMIDWEQARRDKQELDALREQELSEIETEWDETTISRRYFLKQRCTDPGCIYFVMSDFKGTGAAFIKIGVATDVEARLAGLRTGCPVKLALLGTINDIPRDRLMDEERRLHEQFADLRAEGEWFRSHERLLSFIRANATPWIVTNRKTARRKQKAKGTMPRVRQFSRLANLHGPLPQFMTRAMFENRSAKAA